MRQDRLTDTQGTIASSIWYVGELLEYDNSSGGHSKRFVFAGGARVAVIRRDSTQEVTSYLHQDHLGSTDTITDASGGVVQTLSYDPHGLRRDADWQDASGAISSTITTRGFTGHEHLEDLKLIHMNGRVYDPVIGRFLSADPAYQNLAGSQTLNRYAYVLNNPLSYTDPSGFFFKKIFRAIKKVFSKAARVVKKAANSVQKVLAKNEIVRAVVVIAVAAITQQYYLATYGVGTVSITSIGLGDALVSSVTYSIGSQIAAASVGGFVSGLVASGGDLKSAAISAVTAAAFVGVGEAFGHASGNFGSAQHARKIAAHAVVGGASSELQGGKFAHGALTGGFAQFAAPAINGIPSDAGQVAASAVAGGIGAELGGGKFANGAVTGAFGRLYNDLQDLKHTHNGLKVGLIAGFAASATCDLATVGVCIPANSVIITAGGAIGAIGGFIGDVAESVLPGWLNGAGILEARPPGAWPADSGAREWDRRNGTGRRGRNKFHETKQDSPWPGGKEDWSVDPETGEIYDPNGDPYDNLND